MGQLSKSEMTLTEKLFLETLAGHFAWLQSAHPRKAKTTAARRAKQSVNAKLRTCNRALRQAA